MYELFLALFLAFSCPAQSNNHQHKGGTTVTTNNDTEGEGSHIPPK
jgi:hypothetical protein